MTDTDTMMTPDFIVKLASLSKLAYDDDYSKVDFLAVDSDYKKYVECSNSETTMKSFIIIDDTNKRLFVVFKGSKTFESFVADAMVAQLPLYNNTQYEFVHSGFYLAFKSIRDKLSQVIAQYPDYEVYVSGHSLGGALATLFCYLISCKNIPHLCTFGSPRVGNVYFSQQITMFSKESYRFVHSDDAVPMVPFFNYTHIKNLFHIDNDGSEIGYTSFLRKLWYWIRSYGKSKLFSFSDHDEIEYQKVIQLWAAKQIK